MKKPAMSIRSFCRPQFEDKIGKDLPIMPAYVDRNLVATDGHRLCVRLAKQKPEAKEYPDCDHPGVIGLVKRVLSMPEDMLDIPHSEIFSGINPAPAPCSNCDGNGFYFEFSCPECDGEGEIELEHGGHTYAVECAECDGYGSVRSIKGTTKRICHRCNGEGHDLFNEKLLIKGQPFVPGQFLPLEKETQAKFCYLADIHTVAFDTGEYRGLIKGARSYIATQPQESF